MNSNPARVTIETPLVRKVTGNRIIKSFSVEKTQNPVSDFFQDQKKVCNAVFVSCQELDVLQLRSDVILT